MQTVKNWMGLKKIIQGEWVENLAAGLSKVEVIVQESLGVAMQPSV